MVLIILCVIFATLGVIVSVIGGKQPVRIKFSYSPLDWTTPIFLMFVSFPIVFLIEYSISNLISSLIGDSFWIMIIIAKFFDNGLLVPIFSILLSSLFEKMVEKMNLDYLPYYDDLISKVCFTIIIFSWSIAILFQTVDGNTLVNAENMGIINKVLMWMVTVIGTWLGFGFGCKGRTANENKERNNVKKKIDRKCYVKFWLPIMIPLVCCILLLIFMLVATDEMEKYENYLLILTIAFAVPGFVGGIVFKNINNPSIKKSKKNFYKLIRMYENGEITTKNFGRNKYHIEGGTLCIESINVEYVNHEDDENFNRLFNKYSEPIDTNNYDSLLCFLEERNKEQNEYIRRGFENCVEEMRKSKLIHI